MMPHLHLYHFFGESSLLKLYSFSDSISTFDKLLLVLFTFLFVVAPQIAFFSFGEEPANAGDTVSVQCTVSKGDFPLDIAWMFQGHLIQSDREDMIVSHSGKRIKQLTIEAVAARHAGEYTCVASNAAGSASHSATLEVNGTFVPYELYSLPNHS